MRSLSLLLSCCGVAAAVLGWAALAPLMPGDGGAASMAVRLGYGAASLLPSAFVLAAMIAVQMGTRFAVGAFDPQAGDDTPFLRVNQRVISNTVEQLAVFAPALLALAAAVPGGQMPRVMALSAVFAGSRLVFWAGYLAAPMARAPGMAAGFACNAAALVAAAWIWLQ